MLIYIFIYSFFVILFFPFFIFYIILLHEINFSVQILCFLVIGQVIAGTCYNTFQVFIYKRGKKWKTA